MEKTQEANGKSKDINALSLKESAKMISAETSNLCPPTAMNTINKKRIKPHRSGAITFSAEFAMPKSKP